MKRLVSTLLPVMFLALTQFVEAVSEKQTLSGQVGFAVDYKQSMMEANGYQFIGKGDFHNFITNYFGAKSAEILIRNDKGEIIGVDKTKSDGTFTLTVDGSNFYQITIKYHGRKTERTILNAEAIKPIRINIGHFDTIYFPGIKAHD